MTTFIVLKILSFLVVPPGSLALGVLLWLLLRTLRWRRLAVAVLALSMAETLILSFPPFSDAVMSHLEDQARDAAQSSPRCCFDAIVVLGGGISPAMPPARPFPDLTDSADRMWLAARLFRDGHRMVGDKRVALVTSAYHMPRALQIAAHERLAVAAFPTDYRAIRRTRPFWENWIPSVDGLATSTLALKEIIAIELDWRID